MINGKRIAVVMLQHITQRKLWMDLRAGISA